MRSIKTVLAIVAIALLLIRPAARAQDEDWHGKGRRLLGRQQYDAAIKAFSTAIEIIPRDYQSYNYRGVAHALRAQFDRAIADYSKAIEIRPRYAEAYNNRGFAHTRTGNLKTALSDYTRALEINPFLVDAYNNKAWILATSADESIRDGEQALRLATKAVELKPDISSKDTLAAAYAATGNFAKAVDLQTKAIQQLMLEDKTAEVAKYMKHLRSYRSRQALLIDYSAVYKTAATRSTSLAPLKAHTEGKMALLNEKTKVATATNPPKRAALEPAGHAPPQKAGPAPSANLQNTGTTIHKPKPAAEAADGKKAGVPAGTAPREDSPKTVTVAKAPAASGPPGTKSPAPAVNSLPYSIQVNSFRDPQKSMQVARKLNAKGDPAFTSPVDISGKGKRHRVYIGNYGTLAEAKDVAQDLKRRKFRYVIVTRTPFTVQVGEPIPRRNAKALQSRLRAKGYFSYSLPVKGDPDRTRVLVGAFENEQNAARLRMQLQQDGFVPKITLR